MAAVDDHGAIGEEAGEGEVLLGQETAELPRKGRLSFWSVDHQDPLSEDIHPQKGLVVRAGKGEFEKHSISERPHKQTSATHTPPDPNISEELVHGHDVTGALDASLSDDGEGRASRCAGAVAGRTSSCVGYRVDPDDGCRWRDHHLDTGLRWCDADLQCRSRSAVVKRDQHESTGPSKPHCWSLLERRSSRSPRTFPLRI